MQCKNFINFFLSIYLLQIQQDSINYMDKTPFRIFIWLPCVKRE